MNTFPEVFVSLELGGGVEKRAKKQKGCALKASFLLEMAVAGPERVCERGRVTQEAEEGTEANSKLGWGAD